MNDQFSHNSDVESSRSEMKTGRYIRETLNNRLSRLCNYNCAENEIHFQFNCQYTMTFGWIMNDNVFTGNSDKLHFTSTIHARKIAEYLDPMSCIELHRSLVLLKYKMTIDLFSVYIFF